MTQIILTTALPLVVIAALVFLTVRLRLFTLENVGGKTFFIIGGLLLFMASAWQLVKLHPEYGAWFLDNVYGWLDIAQLSIALLGALLLAVGLSLYSDFWQEREEAIEEQWRKLSLLENLQQDAREPYQLLELLSISLKEVLASLPECAGAVFLVNRQRRQLVLACACGVNQRETALLEHYPFERNIISRAIDGGEPTIGGDFEVYERDGRAATSRFKSTLILPLVSERRKLGAIILMSDEQQFFSRSDIRYLAPVAEWVAEKVYSARLERELSLARKQAEKDGSQKETLMQQLTGVASSFIKEDAIDAYCRGLVGLYGSETIHIVGLSDGALEVFGGSEDMGSLGENFRTALIDALSRNKPLIVNQEGVSEEGHTYIAQSTLVYPISGRQRHCALLLRRPDEAFRVGDDDLKIVDLFARLAGGVMRQADSQRLDITRRKGLRRILRLLQFDSQGPGDVSPAFLADNLSDILPGRAGAVIFTRYPDGSYKANDSCGVKRSLLSEFDLLPGEGFIAEAARSREAHFAYGRSEVEQYLQTLEMANRENFYRLFEEKGPPVSLMIAPLLSRDRVSGVATVFFYEMPESERGEWERLLTLTVGLFSFRMTIAGLQETLAPIQSGEIDGNLLAAVINQVNNHLSAVIGNAELAVERPDLSGDVRRHIESIILEAEQASEYVRQSLGKIRPSVTASGEGGKGLNEHISEILEPARISGNLYMISGSPREIDLELRPVSLVEMTDASLRPLILGALNQVAGLAGEGEMLTVSTYRLNDYVYLDISRHSKELPGMTRQASIGKYISASEASRLRPSDTFLAHAAGSRCQYSIDSSSDKPAHLSFKFPVRRREARSESKLNQPHAQVLAIDDQAVILELITAMGQSLGYKVQTATSPEVGLRLVDEHRFDVVLTDLAMPGFSGLEVAARIKRDHPDMPIILLTGWEVNIDQAQLARSGVTNVLHKPFRIEQLAELLRVAVTPKSLP